MRYLGHTDNPIKDADNYLHDSDEWLSMRPVCCYCDDFIQESYAYLDNKYNLYCCHCAENMTDELEKVYISD